MARLNYKEVLKGDVGATYEPHLTDESVLYWTNNGGLENPTPKNIRGKTGVTPNIQIGKVKQIEENESPYVNIVGDKENPIFNFGIPKFKIENFSIKAEKTDFFDLVISEKNIFNIDKVEKGGIDPSNGDFSNIINFEVVKFIEIESNTNYVFSIDGVKSNISTVCFYDENKTFISGLTNVKDFLSPVNSKFLSISIYGKFNIKSQLEKGTTASEFIKYNAIIRNNGLKNIYQKNIIDKLNVTENNVNKFYSFNGVDENIENGYYSNSQFFPNPSYESLKLKCNEFEEYIISCYILGISEFPIVKMYNKEFKEIGNTGVIKNDTFIENFKFVVPENVEYITVTSNKTTNKKINVKRKEINIENLTKNPLKNLKYIAIGDSITAQSDRWRDQFIKVTGAKEIMCTAMPGAHLTDYNDTVLNGTNFEGHGNTVCNQIQKIINNPPVESPDFIIISAITNDTLNVDQLDKDVNVFIESDGFTYKDIETIDRTIVEGAMRWQVEKLYSLFPNTVIFFASPIQAFEGTRATWNILKKEDKIIRIARKMSVQVIKASSESGIYGRYEKRNENGKYLIDGLHPNKKGGIKLGNYYANQIIKYYK